MITLNSYMNKRKNLKVLDRISQSRKIQFCYPVVAVYTLYLKVRKSKVKACFIVLSICTALHHQNGVSDNS